MDILLEDLPQLQNFYEFRLKKHDLNTFDNHKVLEQMEKERHIVNAGEDLPIVFVGDSALYGPNEVRKRLPELLRIYVGVRKFIKRDTMKLKSDTSVTVSSEIHLYYFYQPACKECRRIELVLNAITKDHPQVVIHRYNIFDNKSKTFYEVLADINNLPEKKRLVVPAVFIGGDYLIKNFGAVELESLLVKYSAGSPRLDTLKISMAEESIFKRFERFSIVAVLLAGLLDGVNPCAFATIIFFVSYLLFIGKRRETIITMAISFIFAVFICYLAIGLGAYALLSSLKGIKLVSQIVFFACGIFAIIIGILSLYDFFAARSGKTNRMILQLPLVIKQRIHQEIKEKTGRGGVIIGSFIAGFLISFLEFGCTGQVYLPTITFVIAHSASVFKPIIILVLYNIMFVIPLIVIAVTANVISRDSVAEFLSGKIALVKILTALLFFFLGFLLILSG